MPNVNNNTENIIAVGSHVNVFGSPAIALTIPDDATGILFSTTVAGFYTTDAVTVPTTNVGLGTRLLPNIVHLYPGAPISIFTTGFVNYQFFRTGDTYSLTSRR